MGKTIILLITAVGILARKKMKMMKKVERKICLRISLN
jgi:hypothetical protein